LGIRESILLRVRIAFLLMAGFSLMVLGRIFYLQFMEGDYWAKKAQENGLEYRVIKANRGNILADDGSLLVTSLPFYRVAIDPMLATDDIFNAGVDSLGILLGTIFKDQHPADITKELRLARLEKRRYKVIAKDFIDYHTKKKIEAFPIFREGFKGGGIFEKTDRRYKLFDELARRTLGFVNEDSTGEVKGKGLEFSFNKVLGGTDGQAIFQKIVGGQWKPVNDGSYIRPEDGIDIETTLNVDLQEKTEEALRKALIQHNAKFGTAILMEVETGEIKAVANLGKNENNEYAENNNYALNLAEPGSTFKIFTMAALLEEADGELNLNDTVETGDGTYQFFEKAVMTDPRKGGHGKITVQQVFERSSNIGISKLVFKYFRKEPQKFLDHLNNFGLMQATDFQLVGETKPYIKTLADPTWSGATLPWMSVGYETKLTPLHTLMFCNALANKGKLIQPLLVRRTLYADNTVDEFTPKILNKKICSDYTLEIMRKLMEGVVEKGTANHIKGAPYKIAGKTGTAEKVENKEYTEKHYTSFVGYFPADKPKYSCIVVIDDPSQAGRYGGVVAAPVFREIADFAVKHYVEENVMELGENIKDFPKVKAGNQQELRYLCEKLGLFNLSYTKEDWVSGRLRGDTLKWVANPIKGAMIPSVVGMSLKDAIFILENKGLKVSFSGKGKVVTQSLAIGSRLQKGKKIHLRLG
jgi:cell division protein FtsI (penicillin-binding protein 3)